MSNTNPDTTERSWVGEGKYYVGPYNYDKRISDRVTPKDNANAQFYDSTVRKVLLVPGLRPTISGMVRIAAAVEAAQVPNLTLNIHWWKDREPEALEWAVAEAILRSNFNFSTTITLDNAWSDNWRQGVEDLAELGMKRPVFLIQPMREDRGEVSDSSVYDRVHELMSGCLELGVEPGLMLTDIGRASWKDLVGLSRAALDSGAKMLNPTDSGSSLSHHAMGLILKDLREELKTDVEFLIHTHDDFGLGTAIAVETMIGGDSVELSFNGISDRAGFPSLEETAVVLESMYGIDTGLAIETLHEACAITAEESLPPHPWKAFSGDHAFMLDLPYAAGPALERGRESFPPVWNCVDPHWLGSSSTMNWLRQFMLGPTLELKLKSLNLPTDSDSITRVRQMLAAEFANQREYPIWITEEALDEMCQIALGQRGE